MNTILFFSNFSGTAGISQQNPGISRQKRLISLVSRDIPDFWAPTHSRGRPPPHPKISGPKSSLRAKGTLISEPRCSTPCGMQFFPREKGKMAFVKGFSLTKAVFPFSRGKNRISQGVEHRGSLISVPLALRVWVWVPFSWLTKIRADFREGEEDSNFSVFRVRRFSEWLEALH